MMQSEPDCVVFGINRRQLWRKGTAFLGEWSSRGEIRGVADVEAREAVEHFDEMFDNENSAWPATAMPGEILIRGSIDLEDIVRLYVRDQQHEDRLREAVAEADIEYRGPTVTLKRASWIFGVR